MSRIPRAALLFAASGVLLAVYLLLRPYGPATGVDTVAEFASVWWLVSHGAAMAGFVVGFAAVVDLARTLSGSAGGSTASVAATVTGIGVALLLPYYGAETLALHALGSSARADGVTGELVAADAIRYGSSATVSFGAGLVLLVIGSILLALSVRRAHGPAVWAVPYVAVWAWFPVQFVTPGAARMTFGVVILAACCALAAAVIRTPRPAIENSATAPDDGGDVPLGQGRDGE